MALSYAQAEVPQILVIEVQMEKHLPRYSIWFAIVWRVLLLRAHKLSGFVADDLSGFMVARGRLNEQVARMELAECGVRRNDRCVSGDPEIR